MGKNGKRGWAARKQIARDRQARDAVLGSAQSSKIPDANSITQSLKNFSIDGKPSEPVRSSHQQQSRELRTMYSTRTNTFDHIYRFVLARMEMLSLEPLPGRLSKTMRKLTRRYFKRVIEEARLRQQPGVEYYLMKPVNTSIGVAIARFDKRNQSEVGPPTSLNWAGVLRLSAEEIAELRDRSAAQT